MTAQDERNAKRIIREALIDQRRGADPELFSAVFAQITDKARYGNPAGKYERELVTLAQVCAWDIFPMRAADAMLVFRRGLPQGEALMCAREILKHLEQTPAKDFEPADEGQMIHDALKIAAGDTMPDEGEDQEIPF